MKKVLILSIVLLLGCISIFAAGASEEVIQGPTTIELWSSLSGSKAEVFDMQVAAYNESQDEIYVEVIHQGGYSILRQKIAAAVNAKNMPELIICDYLDVAYYAQLGLLKDLDSLVDPSVMDNYYESMLADLTYDGTVYAVPYNRSTQGFFVNNDALRAAGIESSATTWDEFKEHCIKFKEQGDNFYYAYAFFHQFLFDAIAYTWGAEVATTEGEVKLTDEEMVNMFTFFQDLYNKDLLLMQPVLVGGFEEQNGAFLAGNVATVFQTTSFIPTAEDLLDFDWSFEFVPAGDGGHAVTIGGGSLAVTSQATDKEAEACAKFLEYMSSDEIVAEFFMNTGNLPITKSVMETEEVKTFIEENEAYKKVIEQLEYGKAAPATTKNLRDVFSRMNDLISSIILKGDDVVSTLESYEEIFQAEFDEAISNGEFIR